ncbi:Asp23/Gls24 family envelope stress response protein, partial [Streptomyces parvus]|nr:Asp23/Gls24 family envelope stress response protein [Streptomyces parvus]
MIPAAARGTTTVSARAVAKIAQQAATETPNAVGTVRGTATVRGQRAEVSVRLGLPWPADLGRRAGEVQRHVASRTGELTGLSVRMARLRVARLQRPTGTGAGAGAGATVVFETTAPAARGRRVPRRWWSARPAPVVVTALLGAAAAGLLTADMASV